MSSNHKQDLATIDFSSIMAVAVHDMKNSLSLLLQSIEQLSSTLPETDQVAREHLGDVHYEASRMNTTLVQVLSLYRANMDALPTNIDECFVNDMVEELVDTNLTYTKQRNIAVTVDVDEDLSWYLDKDLIFLLMHDVFVNTIRYGATQVSIKAHIEDKFLSVIVEDDGPGYPENMLAMSNAAMDRLCISEGRTGLGLFFARLIAQTHKNRELNGRIELSNNKTTGGSIFKLLLP